MRFSAQIPRAGNLPDFREERAGEALILVIRRKTRLVEYRSPVQNVVSIHPALAEEVFRPNAAFDSHLRETQ